MRKLKAVTVPIAGPMADSSSEEDSQDGSSVAVCRICLDQNSKLVPLAHSGLADAILNLIGTKIQDDRLPGFVCVECGARLRNFTSLRLKALRSQRLMFQILDRGECLTLQNLSEIDRVRNKLTTNLKTTEPTILMEELNPKEKIDKPLLNMHEVDLDLDVALDDIKTETEDIFCDAVNFAADTDSSDDVLIKDLKKAKVKRKKREKKHTEAIEVTEPKIDRRRRPLLNADLTETLFTITELTVEEQLAEIVKRQESSNFKNSLFKCMECFKGFLDEEAFNSHMVRHTDRCGEYKCTICKTNFKTRNALRKHITAHHSQRFSCNSCDYVTSHRQTARLHERWHKGTKYQCPHCPDEFFKFTTYMGHIRIKHPSDFVCALCGYSFVSHKGIELHKKLKHRLDNVPIPEDGPKCVECNVTFVSPEALKRHLQISRRHSDTDTGEKVFNKPRKQREVKQTKDSETKTGEDPKKYPSQVRKAEGPIPCEQCGLQLEDSRAYHGHFRRAHPDKNRTNYPSMKSPTMCEVCGRIFQSYALLKDHTWVHTGEKPFKCELCGKTFRMKQRLVAHGRVHAATRARYPCPRPGCGKVFSTHSNRQRHMFIHTGLKPFPCEQCGRQFKHASEKRAHVTYVHLKKPWPRRARRRPAAGERRDHNSDMDAQLWPPCPQEKIPEQHEKTAYYT